MNSSPPAVAPGKTSLGGSHPEEGSPDKQRTLGESEAMRRVQDLLAAGKLSVSDIVLFEYFNHSFSARIMADGSLRSNTDHKEDDVDALSMLYSSPSEFASAMATSVATLDDKGTKPKGKVAINGWKSCTVDGRSLATIRNEMLYERKNELASMSKERVRESAPVLLTGKQSEAGSEESLRLCESSVTGLTAGTIHSLQGFGISSRNRKGSPLGNHSSLPWKKKSDLLSDGGGDNASGKCTEAVAGDEEGVTLSFEGKLGANSSLSTRDVHKSTEERKSSSPEVPINPISERSSIQRRESLQSPAANPGMFDKTRHDKNFSEVCEQRGTAPIIENVTKLEKQKSGRSNVGHSSQWQGNDGGFAKNGSETKCYDEIQGDEEKFMNIERISTLSAELTRQTKAKEQEVRHDIPRKHEEIKSQVLDRHVKTTSSTRAEIDITNESKGSTAGSKDSNGKNDNRLALVEQCDGICTAQREMVTVQAKSSKEVSDLQQEILGDSDSEEESFLERGNGDTILPKKRSRSSSSDENRKKTRTEDYPDQEMDDAETRSEAVKGLGFDDKTPANHNTKTDVEATHLDPDTVEAAAIAAQIEKEEASTRARRTTRLAAGKIKQVDYKTPTGQQVTRSISPELGWEESNRRSIEIEHSMDIVRTTRRRSAPNQWQPPQRSSRRVATKLRSGYDREMLSNEEMDCHSTRTDGRGPDLRVDRQAIPIEDVEGKGRQGFRLNDPRADSSDRRRGRTESSSKKARDHFQEDGDPHSHGRPLSVRAGARDNHIADSAEIADLSDPDDILSDAEDLQGVSDADDSDLTGTKIDDIKYLAEAVRFCESADPRVILKALNEQDQLKNDDLEKHRTRDLLQESIECIQNMPTLLDGQKGSTCPAQLLSFLAAESWRFVTRGNSNDSARKPTTLMKRAGKEDLLRISIERSRKKEHRDVEELRASLEKEMECRRRAELDSLFVEIHSSEVSRAVAREKTRCCRLKQETKKYRDMERVILGRLEGAKILVGQLRGETDEADAIGVGTTRTSLRDGARIAESLTDGSFVLPSFRKGPNERIAEDYAGVTNKNVTTTSRRLMEMDRLRALIAAREVEAEEFQRICEKERMHFVRTMELKTRLETELYLSKSQGSVTHGFLSSPTLTVVNSTAKDGLKKGDTRGSSTHTTRGPGYIKQKTATSGKNATALQFTNKLPVPGSRPKPGRVADGPKHVKKKHPARNGGNGGNGNDRS